MEKILIIAAVAVATVIIMCWVRTWKEVNEIHKKLEEDLNEWY